MLRIPVRMVENTKLYINDRAYSVNEIEKTCIKLCDKIRIALVVIDYLQLIRGDIPHVVNRLKQLTRGVTCPVVLLSSLGRSAENRKDHRPMMSDIKNYGRLDCYADKVLFLYRDDYYSIDTEKKGEAEIIVAKNTGGLIGTVPLRHLGCGAFDDMPDRISRQTTSIFCREQIETKVH